MMDWLAVLCRLPTKFKVGAGGGGVIQGTSSEAVLVALLAARAQVLRGRPAADKLKLVAYASDQVGGRQAILLAGVRHLRASPQPLPRAYMVAQRHEAAWRAGPQ